MPSYMHNDNALTSCIHRAFFSLILLHNGLFFRLVYLCFLLFPWMQMEDLICLSRDRVQPSLYFPPKPSPREKEGCRSGDGIICATDFVIPKIPSLLATNINFLTFSLQACLMAYQDHVLFTSNCSGRSGVEKEWKKKDN